MKLGFVTTILCCSIALALSQAENNKESIDEYRQQLAKGNSTFAGQGDQTVGEHVAGAKLLHSVKIEQPYVAGLWRNHAEMHFKKSDYRITLIEVVNNQPADNGPVTFEGFAGVGKSYVEIDFESEARSGIYYTVNVHGVPKNASGQDDVRSGLERAIHGGGNNEYGKPEAGEELIHDQRIAQPWTCCWPTEYAEIHFKKNYYRITRIVIKMVPNQDGANYDIYGGIGENYADFYFTSHPWWGIWYDVRIYGKRV